MNEDEASALFAPARERPVPPAAFSMADVFAEDSRVRRRHRVSAVLGTVAVVLAVVIGSVVVSNGGGTNGEAHPSATTPAAPAPSLAELIAGVSLPPDAKPVASLGPNNFGNSPYADAAGYQQRVRYWTTKLAPAAALKALRAHLPAGMTYVDEGHGTVGGLPFVTGSFRAAETARLYGPRLLLNAQAAANGSTELTTAAWEIAKPAKTAAETVGPGVTSVVGSYDGKQSVTVDGAAAQQLARDFNALWVNEDPPSSCPPSANRVTLTFRGPGKTQTFDEACGLISPAARGALALKSSPALEADLRTYFAGILPTPAPSIPPEQTAPTPTPPGLAAVLHQFPVPPGASRLEHAVGPGLQVGTNPATVRKSAGWSSPWSRAATVAWLKQHLPADWTGSFNISRGDHESDGMYNGPANDSEYGPNLTIAVVDAGAGATIRVEAWEVALVPKTAAETVTGVTGATVTAVNDQGQSLSVQPQSPASASKLAADLNALPVNPELGGSCTVAEPDLVLTFTTRAGARRFLVSRNCRYVSPKGATGPALSTSAALITDLETATAAGVGQLTLDIRIVGGPRGTPVSSRVAGAITISEAGALIARGHVAEGGQFTNALVPGSYQVVATSGYAACVPETVTLTAGQRAHVTVTCHIK